MNQKLTKHNDIIVRGGLALDKGWKPCGEERCSISITDDDNAILYMRTQGVKHIWKLIVPLTELIQSLEEFEDA